MAAPASKTIADLSGKWTLNKSLSDSTDPALTLQGVSWLIRKGIGAATIAITVKEYVEESPSPSSESSPPTDSTTTTTTTTATGTATAAKKPITHIDIDQTASGLKGTAERRVLDFQPREHRDWIFGRVEGRSRFISVADFASLVAAEVQKKEGGWADSEFLVLDWIDDAKERAGPDGEALMMSFVTADAGWTAVQGWGFQMIGGERRYVRNVTVSKDGKYENFKMIYDFVSE
ncbi:hypothetical protein GGR50DRAFT_692153 [Xylaria sp. CBS 124048]|nr:hypothetical protein GGR50DRAFT_692153 [Xylaria sp. CBS 124048]